MSRAYRISVRESVTNVVCAEDHVSCELELLGILPADQMADLLAAELTQKGFERDGDKARRQAKGVTVTVDLKSGTVTVRAQKSEEVEIQGEKTGYVYNLGESKQREEELRKTLQKELTTQTHTKKTELQKEVTDALEAQLGDLRSELDGAVNRATAQALKQRAAQLGQIKTITEDPQAGSLTIVVEV
ncbi:MAG: hypothetical protein ACTHK7_05805 [Aureliella sp.]